MDQNSLNNSSKKCYTVTLSNPQANDMTERVHLSMGDKLRTTTFEGEDWFTDVDQELQAIAWAIRSTINSSIDHTPGQLVFGTDMLFQSKIKVGW